MAHNPFDLDGQRQALEVRETRDKLKQIEAEQDFLWLMGCVRGRRIVWGLLELAGVFRSSYTGDNNATNFNEGQRNVGLGILAKLMAYCPGSYELMVKEQKNDRNSDNRNADCDNGNEE